MELPNIRVKIMSGSGVADTAAGSALMTAKSPSAKFGGLEGRIVAVSKDASTIVGVPLTSMVVGVRSPLRLASVGCGLTPPIAIGLPSSDSPSGFSVK